MKRWVTNMPLRFVIVALLVTTFSCTMAIAQDSKKDIEKQNQAKESFNQAIESIKAGDTTAAITFYKGALKLDDKLADAYLNLGSIYFAQKNYKEAEANFKKYTEINATDPLGFSNLAKVYVVQKKTMDAQAAYEAALTADSGYMEAYKELGKLFYNAKKYDDCISNLKKYTAKVANDYYAFYKLGTAYAKKKNYSKAIDSYKKALAIKSNHFESLRNLGNIYRQQEKFSQAISYYKKALKVKPKDYKTAYNLAIAVQSSNPEDYDSAIAAWQRFLKLARKVPKANKYVASTEKLIKDLKEAKAVANE